MPRYYVYVCCLCLPNLDRGMHLALFSFYLCRLDEERLAIWRSSIKSDEGRSEKQFASAFRPNMDCGESISETTAPQPRRKQCKGWKASNHDMTQLFGHAVLLKHDHDCDAPVWLHLCNFVFAVSASELVDLVTSSFAKISSQRYLKRQSQCHDRQNYGCSCWNHSHYYVYCISNF